MRSIDNEDMQTIRKFRTFPFAYAMNGILSRLGFIYNEKTKYYSRYDVSIRYDELKKDYEIKRNGSSYHIFVDGLISIAKEKLHENSNSNSKVESNHIQAIKEKVEVLS